ncbi:MAG: 2OG-Fe(II) oxygenase family protein [Bacteroidota bacterium]
MISQSQQDHFLKTGIWYTGIPRLDSSVHQSCYQDFLARAPAYKSRFLQTNFNSFFEGYSFMGQEDSANQYAEDRLYTYVISDYFDATRHAAEFAPLINEQQKLIHIISELEKEIVSALFPSLFDFYNLCISHSLSTNFYPAGDHGKQRLSPHPDGSLFTVFPFGIDEEFQYQNSMGSWCTIAQTDQIICFSGYLLELMSGFKALNHQVVKEGPQNARFSFAYFSIPRPDCTVTTIRGQKISTAEYYSKYLSLFE